MSLSSGGKSNRATCGCCRVALLPQSLTEQTDGRLLAYVLSSQTYTASGWWMRCAIGVWAVLHCAPHIILYYHRKVTSQPQSLEASVQVCCEYQYVSKWST